MVLRVDVVAAALEAVYGGAPEHRVVALTPQGRPLDAGGRRGARRGGALTLLSARFEGFDERDRRSTSPPTRSRSARTSSRAASCRRWCSLDAVARRLPGALGSEDSGELESFSAELDGGLEYPHYTRPAEFRGWTVPDVLLSGDHARIDDWRKEQSR